MGFTQIDNEVLESQEITKNELITYIAIIRYYNKEKGYAYPSYKQIKSICKIKDDRTLINAIDGLIEKGFIKKETVKGIGNKYYIPTVKLQVQEEYSNSDNTVTPTVKLQDDILENYSTTNTNTNTNISTNNIYSSLENELQINKIKKNTEDLLTKINKNYSKELIKKEFEKLKIKEFNSELELLVELNSNLENKRNVINKENNKDIEVIFNYWNEKKIIKHKKLTEIIRKAVGKSLKIYSLQEIKQAIDIYSEILNSDFYFNYKWSLSDFLTRKNGISTFLEEGTNKINYDSWKKGANKNGYTSRVTFKDRGRFTEGSEEINYKPPVNKNIQEFTEEDYERLGII